MKPHEFTIASMGHPQNGKSSVMGCLALHFRGEERLGRLLEAIEQKVKDLRAPELRYALIFDLPKSDFSLHEEDMKRHDPAKTFSKLPGWLGCHIGKRPTMLVDEPGHTRFLKYIVAPTAGADVGILVFNVADFLDNYRNVVEIHGEDCFYKRVTVRDRTVPYLLHIDREAREATAKRRAQAKAGKATGRRWIPRITSTLVNYMALVELFAIPRVIVAVHQMDRVDYDEKVFQQATVHFRNMTEFLRMRAEVTFIPTAVIARDWENHNVVTRSSATPWYHGPTIAERVEDFAAISDATIDSSGPLRVQLDRFASGSPSARHSPPPRIFGRIDSGVLTKGDEVCFTPLGVSARVKEIRLRDESRFFSDEPYWNDKAWAVNKATAGQYVAVSLTGRDFGKFVERAKRKRRVRWLGQVMSHIDNPPPVAKRIRARLMIVPPWWVEVDLKNLNLIHGYFRASCLLDGWEPGNDGQWWQCMTVEISCKREFAVDTFRGEGTLGKIIIERENFMVAGGAVTEVVE